MSRFLIATCREYLELAPSDALIATALRGRGHVVSTASWRGDDFWDRADDYDAVIVRSIWDYPDHREEFSLWLSRAETYRGAIMNPPALMRWNADKRYLFDLAARGVATPLTCLVQQTSDLADAFDTLGATHAVIKPTVGGSGRGVQRVDLETATRYVEAMVPTGTACLLQELIPEIVSGELSFVFLGGDFSHAVRLVPAAGDFRVNTQYRPSSVTLFEPSQELVSRAQCVLDALPMPPAYARIDCVARDAQVICLEAELIDPALRIHLYPPAAERFAEVVEREIGHRS